MSSQRTANRITSPLFVAQGYNDPRVPWTEAEQIVKAVRGNGGEVWYLMFKDEGHGFRKKGNSDYFGAAGVELLAGRMFDRRDGADAVQVAIVNRALTESMPTRVAPTCLTACSMRAKSAEKS